MTTMITEPAVLQTRGMTLGGYRAVASDAATGIMVERGGRTADDAVAAARASLVRAVANHYRSVFSCVQRAAAALAAHPSDAGRERALARVLRQCAGGAA